MSKGKQIGLIVLAAFAYLYLATTRDNMGIDAIALMLIVLLTGMAILAFIINQVINLFKKSQPSFGATFRVCIFLYLVLLCFDNSSQRNKPESASANYQSSSTTNYSSTATHHCTWCKREYSIGYLHVANECVHPEKDPGFDMACSPKCCWDEWNSTR